MIRAVKAEKNPEKEKKSGFAPDFIPCSRSYCALHSIAYCVY